MWWGCRQPGHRHGLSKPVADASRLQNTEFVEYILTTCGTLAIEGGSISWVATHRMHLPETDKEGDPHSPRDGGIWSHMDGSSPGRAMHQDRAELLPYVPASAQGTSFISGSASGMWCLPVIVAVSVLCDWAAGPALLGSLHAYRRQLCMPLAGELRRRTCGARSAMNRRHFNEQLLVAILTFGEGWHNNHHAEPQAARHGHAWYELDVNWYGIYALKTLGLAGISSVPRLQAEKTVAASPPTRKPGKDSLPVY